MDYYFKCLENLDSKTVNFILLTVPWTDSLIPLMAPAALKPIVESTNLTCLATDLNAEIFAKFKKYPKLITFFYDEKIEDQETLDLLNDLYSSIAKSILTWNPTYIGLSLFSYASQVSAKWIAYFIKKLDPTVKIVIGGTGCLDTFVSESSTFMKLMLKEKLIDFHIRGDAEHSLVEFINANYSFPGINDTSWREMSKEELSRLPYPDYSDYNFDIYSSKTLPLIGTRGCVRKCKFCDYIENWKKFQWRTADDIFAEMLEQHKQYNIRVFKFQDSLVNGNMNEFLRLMELLAEYNIQNPNKSFKWGGYYILRNVTSRTEYEWEMVAKSGASTLMIGIENFNEDIRYDIGKKFTNEAIDFHLAQALKYNINLSLLNIVGYVTETQEHIDFIKTWLDKHLEYRSLVQLQWGAGLGIFPNTYLSNHQEQLGVILKDDSKAFDWSSTNIETNPKIRAKWVNELVEYSKQLGYPVIEHLDNHYILEKILSEQI